MDFLSLNFSMIKTFDTPDDHLPSVQLVLPLFLRRLANLSHHDEAKEFTKFFRAFQDLGWKSQEDRLPFFGIDL
jgi:hypothetical protein